MKTRNKLCIAFAAMTLAVLVGASQSQADPCSASASTLVSRSAGGTCPSALALNDTLTLQYRIQNASIVDDPGGPNDGTGVAAKITGGKTFSATLAQATGGVGGAALPGTLVFVPVCAAGSTGPLNPGDNCDPANNQCGGACGCVSNLTGVTCTQNVNQNKVTLTVGSDLSFSAGQSRTLATIKVKLLAVVPATVCGEFFTRVDSSGDVLVTNDALCDNPVTAGAQASANLDAPVCTVDANCGDAQCNQCAEVGTNNHCAPKAADTACGSDSTPTDCLRPACVINQSNVGVCTQQTIDAAENTACSTEGGTPVPTVDCQAPSCNASGACVNKADASQNGDACGSDQNPNDCSTPICSAGACSGQGNVPNGTSCDDGLFCTNPDTCTSGVCSGSARNCGDQFSCTADSCDDNSNTCVHTPNDASCADQDSCTIDACSAQSGCTHQPDPSCSEITDICRSPGYWATHSGYEGKKTVNMGQMVIDAAGGLEVCGQTITKTSNLAAPYLDGLGLSSDLEGLCVSVKGVTQRQLYRQLTAAALNCAITGDDCDAVLARHTDVTFSECSALCASLTPSPVAPLAPVPTLTANKCISRLDCFNNGGQIIDGKCATGLCDGVAEAYCGAKYGDCVPTEAVPEPVCVPFEKNCHAEALCNEALGVCPTKTAASSSAACREAKGDSCTIDSCE